MTSVVAVRMCVDDLVKYKTMEKLFENKIKVPTGLLQDIQKLSKAEKDMYKICVIDDAFNALNGTYVSDMINKTYIAFKKVSKYVSDNAEHRDIDFWDLNGKKTLDCSLETFKHFVAYKQGAPAWTWHHLQEAFMWYDQDKFNTECKRFRKLRKEGNVIIHEYNNKTAMLGDVEWYCLVIQSPEESPDGKERIDPICPASMNLFGMMVSGFVYWFNKKSNRDTVYKFLTK